MRLGRRSDHQDFDPTLTIAGMIQKIMTGTIRTLMTSVRKGIAMSLNIGSRITAMTVKTGYTPIQV